jgi:hypothetical protein
MSYSQSVYYKLTPQRFVQTVDSLLAPGEINGLDASNLLCWTSNSALQGSCKADSDTTEGRNKGSALHGRDVNCRVSGVRRARVKLRDAIAKPWFEYKLRKGCLRLGSVLCYAFRAVICVMS